VDLGQQALQVFGLGFLALVEDVLLGLGKVFDGGQAVVHLLDAGAVILLLFLLGEGKTRPAFLLIGFECDPFLAEAVFCQALHF